MDTDISSEESINKKDIIKNEPISEIQNFVLEKNKVSGKKISPAPIETPIWLSISEASKIGGVTTKTIRRAISAKVLSYKIINDRYLIDCKTLLVFLFSNKKLKNKLNQKGLGQYVEGWKKIQ